MLRIWNYFGQIYDLQVQATCQLFSRHASLRKAIARNVRRHLLMYLERMAIFLLTARRVPGIKQRHFFSMADNKCCLRDPSYPDIRGVWFVPRNLSLQRNASDDFHVPGDARLRNLLFGNIHVHRRAGSAQNHWTYPTYLSVLAGGYFSCFCPSLARRPLPISN